MTLVKSLVLAAALSVVAAGSAAANEETRTLPAFTAVDFTGIGRVEATAGEEQSVVVSGSKKGLERVVTEVKDGALKIKWDKARNQHSWLWRFVMPDDDDDGDKITIKVTVPKLTRISVAGAASVNAKGIDSESMDFSVAGAAKIKATGRADKVSLTISGAGVADLDHLQAKDATVSLTGAGKATVYPTENLTATISGAGEIRYEGEPHVVSSISGAGSIRSK